MHIKITALTAEQVKALREEVNARHVGFVVGFKTTYAILNGDPAECLATVQDVMNDLRERHGARYGNYRALQSVRTKLELASKAPNRTTTHVTAVPNGVNGNGDVPSVLSGTKVVEAEPVVPNGKRGAFGEVRSNLTKEEKAERRAAREAEARAKAAPEYPEGFAPTAQPPLTAACRPNFEYMARTATTDGARRTWERLLAALPV